MGRFGNVELELGKFAQRRLYSGRYQPVYGEGTLSRLNFSWYCHDLLYYTKDGVRVYFLYFRCQACCLGCLAISFLSFFFERVLVCASTVYFLICSSHDLKRFYLLYRLTQLSLDSRYLLY